MTCETCKFWKRYADGTDHGECRLHPPVLTNDGWLFPCLKFDEWCGEYEKKEEKK